MGTNTVVTRPQGPAGTPPRRRVWLRRAAWSAAVIVALVLGIAVGTAGQSYQISSANHNAATLRGELRQAQQGYAQAKQDAAAAQSRADNAVAAANQAAKVKYAGKMAAANALLGKLRAEQKIVQQNTISQDGVYVLGQDIAPGTYHTSGAGAGSDSMQCYYATLNSTNTSDIADNNNFNGPETVTVSGGAREISGGCQWTKIG